MLLYLERPNVEKFSLLNRIGAGLKPGPFRFDDTAASADIISALAQHRVAAVDSPRNWLLPVLWKALRPDPAGGGYVGPCVFFDPARIESPLIQGGIPLAEAFAAYIAAAPVKVAPIAGTVALPNYRASPLWRRRILPPVNIRPGDRADWLARQAAAPQASELSTWYAAERRAHWRRLLVGRMLDDLSARRIVAWAGGTEIPPSWWASALNLDLDRGTLFGPAGATVATEIRVYRAGERPAVLEARDAIAPGADARRAVADFVELHRAELEAITPRTVQISYIRARLRVSEITVRAVLSVAFGEQPGGPRQVRPVIDRVIAEHHAALASISERARQAAYVAERVPADIGRKNIYARLAIAFGPASPGGRRRQAEAAAA